ncbi:hypothetical protein CYR55_14085 [Chimaeribacter californicus]|uniref:Uncharacterized protein n=1 Tax=Chimaeribacter californicus TaxID=2060067 RepID=A0A2N5E2W1_9GAMM|nr:hypothetical protein [Chimaeribacter californicus]PLR35030.1 hypothetical protein CYR55_14085 [Chimaeribacter californicus]
MDNRGFDKEDVQEIISRKAMTSKLNKADYQEIGRNAAHGTVEVVKAALALVGVVAEFIPDESIERKDGYRDGWQGYGHYISDVRVDSEPYE